VLALPVLAIVLARRERVPMAASWRPRS
jgi:hypothetical protein